MKKITEGKCEYCGRPIVETPVTKVIRNKTHTFCSAFCFRLFFYDAPRISYEDLQKMYSYYCVSVPLKDFQQSLQQMMSED